MTFLAVTPPPVNAIRATSADAASALPVISPHPLTRLTTPGGQPASSMSETSRNIDSGVNSDGFNTQVFPKAMAEAICILASASGAFQGANKAATPAG